MPLLVEFILISTFSSKSPGVPPFQIRNVFGPTVFSGVLSPTMTPFSTRQNFGSPSQSWKSDGCGPPPKPPRPRPVAAGWPAAAAALASSACFAAAAARASARASGARRQALAVEDVLEAGPILERDRRDNRAAASATAATARSARRLLTTLRRAGGRLCGSLRRLRACSDRRYGSDRDGGGQCHGQHPLHLFSLCSEGLRPSDSPTRSLASRFGGSLRSRGSLTAFLAERILQGSPRTPTTACRVEHGWSADVFTTAPLLLFRTA